MRTKLYKFKENITMDKNIWEFIFNTSMVLLVSAIGIGFITLMIEYPIEIISILLVVCGISSLGYKIINS